MRYVVIFLFFRILDFARLGKSLGARECRRRLESLKGGIVAAGINAGDTIKESPFTGEIAVIMPDTDLDGGEVVRQRIGQALSRFEIAAGGRTRDEVGFESGLASCPDQENTAAGLIARARRYQPSGD